MFGLNHWYRLCPCLIWRLDNCGLRDRQIDRQIDRQREREREKEREKERNKEREMKGGSCDASLIIVDESL